MECSSEIPQLDQDKRFRLLLFVGTVVYQNLNSLGSKSTLPLNKFKRVFLSTTVQSVSLDFIAEINLWGA